MNYTVSLVTVSTNEVASRSAQVVVRLVTDLRAGKPSRNVTLSHPGQLSLAIPPWVDAVTSTGDC